MQDMLPNMGSRLGGGGGGGAAVCLYSAVQSRVDLFRVQGL